MFWKVLAALVACVCIPGFAHAECGYFRTDMEQAADHARQNSMTMEELFREEDFLERTPAFNGSNHHTISCSIETREAIEISGRKIYAINLSTLRHERLAKYETVIRHGNGGLTKITDKEDHHEVYGSSQTVGRDVPHREVIRSHFRPEQGDRIMSIDLLKADGSRLRIFSLANGSLTDQARAASKVRDEVQKRAAAEAALQKQLADQARAQRSFDHDNGPGGKDSGGEGRSSPRDDSPRGEVTLGEGKYL